MASIYISGMEKGNNKSKLVVISFLLFIVVCSSFVFAANSQTFGGGGYTPTFSGQGMNVVGGSTNPQFNNPSFFNTGGFTSPSVYWPEFGKENCYERQDFIMQIAPGGCSPAVVRSDLLEEQNVPVFCKIMSLQVNPLIDVSKIRSLHFKKDYPEGVASISYFPARAALRSRERLISSPLEDNLGYLVIVLKKQDSEKEMLEFVEGNITATIDYDVEGAFGVGNTNFYASEMTDEEWLRDYKKYGFWNGKGYVRADSIGEDKATISIYKDAYEKESTITLKRGETSREIYLGGLSCSAGMNIRLDNLGAPIESALLQIDDEQVWVARGDRILNNRCTVGNLDIYEGGGKIDLSCPVENGRFSLSLNPGKVSLKKDGGEAKEYGINDLIGIAEANVYLGYTGQIEDKTFAVLVKDKNSINEGEFVNKGVYSVVHGIVSSSENIGKKIESLEREIINAIESEYKKQELNLEKDSVKILKTGNGGDEIKPVFGVIIDKGVLIEDVDLDVMDLGEEKEFYEKSIQYYNDLADFYPYEKRIVEEVNAEYYAAEGLYEAAHLSKLFGMNIQANEFFTRLITDYADSSWAESAKKNNELLSKYDSKDSKAIIYLDSEQYFVDLLDFKKPSKKDSSVILNIEGEREELELGEIKKLDNEKGTIQIKELKQDSVVIRYYKKESVIRGTVYDTEELSFEENKNQAIFGDSNVRLVEINLNEQAKISITPKIHGPRTESNFKFRIGIEKRAIQLSPEKTEKMIENLDEQLKKWSEINEKLGKAVKALKAACFATSAMLTVKNLFSGWSGESMARNEIMTNPGGWNDRCKALVETGEKSKMTDKSYSSLQSCILGHEKQINEAVKIRKEEIEKTNKMLEDIQEPLEKSSSDPFDWEKQVDSVKVSDGFEKKFDEECKKFNGEIMLPDGNKETTVNFNEACKWETMTHEQRREILTWYNTKKRAEAENNPALADLAKKELGRTMLNSRNYYETNTAREAAEKAVDDLGLNLKISSLPGDKLAPVDMYQVKGSDVREDGKYQKYRGIEEGDRVMVISVPNMETRTAGGGTDRYTADPRVANKPIVVKFKQSSDGSHYEFDQAYDAKTGATHKLIGEDTDCVKAGGTEKPNGDGSTEENKVCDDVNKGISESTLEYLQFKGSNKFIESNAKAYENKMLHPEKLRVKYFERAPYKGLPSEVPFDVDNGWYVEMEYILSGFGKPYDDSGRVVNYYICNVGPNGLIEFKRSNDDICRYYNGNTADLNFPGMDSSTSRRLISLARQSISDAAKYYGKEKAIINGRTFGTGISFGGEAGQCTDFMPPGDCNILFNVCDPVICPSSRCDLGGNFKVDNVVQSGIIGSLVLCLPNIKEGIAVPICLSGVHAGIEGYVSILNSTQKCLKESLETGRNIGICDEIKSVYMCEFFWKQAAPFLNVLIPRLIEGMYSQGTRGGGEYLTVQNAWNNMQSSIDYFKNDYAVNSIEAFNTRSAADIGGEVCKSFTSTNVPGGNFFDNLIEPDSPEQYSAWFSENELTSATVPATSHYKVYYHIYAGKDEGAYYVVYLKDLPESNYVHSSQTRVVDRGYINKAGQVDEAKDFSAVAGYKQLCISINGRDECGFQRVSTSYFLNTLTDSYAAEQIKTGIISEKECVAGSASAQSLLQPNLQAGVQEIINPELYNHGIIRVCSTYNPGRQVDLKGEYDTSNSNYDRWKEVGYCDDQTIKCWIDTTSVKNVIKDKGLEEQELGEIDLSIQGWDEADYIDGPKSLTKISEAEEFINKLKKPDVNGDKFLIVVEKLEELSELSVLNNFRARAVYLLGRLYKRSAELFKSPDVQGKTKPKEKNGDVPPEPKPPEKAPKLEFDDIDKGVFLVSEDDPENKPKIEIKSKKEVNGKFIITYLVGKGSGEATVDSGEIPPAFNGYILDKTS